MPPISSPGSPVPGPRPDPEALLLAAVHQRQDRRALELVKRLVHRRGVGALDAFQNTILPATADPQAPLWLASLLAAAAGPLDQQGWLLPPRERARDPQRAVSAVDAAIAAMMAEFPELGGSEPLDEGPGAPPQPGQNPEPQASAEGAPPAPAPVPRSAAVLVSPPAPVPARPPSASPLISGGDGAGVEAEVEAKVEPEVEGQQAPWRSWSQRVVGGAAGLGHRLRRRLPLRRLTTQAGWQSSPGSDSVGAPTAGLGALEEDLLPPVLPVAGERSTSSPSGGLPASGAAPLTLPDPLLLPERRGPAGSTAQVRSAPCPAQPAPAPAALADLRAWLPDPDLRRAG